MYHKIIEKGRTGTNSDLLLTVWRNEEADGEQVTLSFWQNKLYAFETVNFDSLGLATSFIRDFSDVSAVDFIERVGKGL